MKRFVAIVATALVVVSSLGVGDAFIAPRASALSASSFNPANIISDNHFFDRNAMSQVEIQAFLDDKIGACLNANCLNIKRVDSTARPADPMCSAFASASNELTSSLIFRVQQSCGVSARVLLVTLQKEQSLATHRAPSDGRLDRAMGYACPDNPDQPGWCDPRFGGLSNQIYRAAWQMKRYSNPPGTSNYFTWYPVGTPSAVRFHPNSACGSTSLTIQNRATAALYYYTPYQPNPAALANLRGTGDSCSAYGNRNFWVFFSDWFDPSTFIPPAGAPSAPRDPRLTVNSGSALTFEWTEPQVAGTSPVIDYVVSYTSAFHPTPIAINDGVSAETRFTVNNPTPGLRFTFWIQAKNSEGVGPAVTIVATPPPSGSPSPPRDVTVDVNDGSELRLTWSTPDDSGTSPIGDYVISYTSRYHPTPVVVNDGVSTSTSFAIQNPTPGLTFTFWIQAKNDAGAGGASTISVTPPQPSVAAVPSAPTGLQVAVNNGSQLTLNWSPPSSEGSSPVSDYVISYTSRYHPTPVVVNDGVSTATTFTTNNPTPGLEFTFRVQAKNGAGLSVPASIRVTVP